jgi:hypothetical protein
MLTEVQIIKENASVESSAMTGAPERVRPGKGPMRVAALHSEDKTTAVTTGAVAAPRGTQDHHVIPDNETDAVPVVVYRSFGSDAQGQQQLATCRHD